MPKTMAFGGVATGNMKAHEADKVARIISGSGFTLIATAGEPSRGRTICVVAVLDVSSVRKVSSAQMEATMPTESTPASPAGAIIDEVLHD